MEWETDWDTLRNNRDCVEKYYNQNIKCFEYFLYDIFQFAYQRNAELLKFIKEKCPEQFLVYMEGNNEMRCDIYHLNLELIKVILPYYNLRGT